MDFLACAVIAFLNRKKRSEEWEFPLPVYWMALVFLGLGYTLSGIHKAQSTSWQNGLALSFLMENPLSRPGIIKSIFSGMPVMFLKIQTWGALALEVLGLPLLLIPKIRFLGWLLFVGMHVSIMLIVDFVDLTMGMILIHLFVFDENWLKYFRRVLS